MVDTATRKRPTKKGNKDGCLCNVIFFICFLEVRILHNTLTSSPDYGVQGVPDAEIIPDIQTFLRYIFIKYHEKRVNFHSYIIHLPRIH